MSDWADEKAEETITNRFDGGYYVRSDFKPVLADILRDVFYERNTTIATLTAERDAALADVRELVGAVPVQRMPARFLPLALEVAEEKFGNRGEGGGSPGEEHWERMNEIETRMKQEPRAALGGRMKFRKKPVVIEAVEWDGVNLDPVVSLDTEQTHTWVASNGKLFINTLEGEMTASPGDWIIKGVKGEFYPCKPDIFAATYDPVEETA